MTAGSPHRRPRMRFIYNPRSGVVTRKAGVLALIEEFRAAHDLPATLVPTERAGHAAELARAAVDDGCAVVVAVGGDGTINQVASALVGTEAALGLLPCGSGNGLGRHLGIRTADAAACRTLLEGRIRQIDTGWVEDRPFFNTMGLGFDVEIARRFNLLTRRGLPAYVATTLRTWVGYSSDHYTIEAAGESITSAAFLISIANSDQYGNDCFIAPGARIDDGLLDLTLVRRVHPFNAVPLALHLFRRTITAGADIVRRRAPAFRILRRQPGPIHTDGEVHEAPAELHVRVQPASLRVLVPAAS